MQIQDLITYLKSLVDYVYYPYLFPRTASDEVAAVKIHGGPSVDEDTGVKQPYFQVLLRGAPNDLQNTEDKSHELFNALTNRQNEQIGEYSVVTIRPNSSSPTFIGLDENERPIFSMNFNTVIRPNSLQGG